MKIKIVFMLFLCFRYQSLLSSDSRELNDNQILYSIIDNKELMGCLFKHSIEQNQNICISQSQYDEQQKLNIQKIAQIIKQIQEKDKSCKQIIDQKNFINCRKKIIFEIQSDNNMDQKTQLVAHIFTSYLNQKNDVQQKLIENQQKFNNFIDSKYNVQKGETNLKINIDKGDQQQKDIASNFIQNVQNQKQNAKEIISQESPQNLNVEMLDHTIQKFSIDDNEEKNQIDQVDQDEDGKDALQKIENENDLKLANEKIKTYEALGKSNDTINYLFKDVNKKLEELKREQERNKILKEEKERINKDLKQDIYSKNIEDSDNKINQLRQEITDHLIYSKSLINQKKLDMKIIRKLSSMDQLKKTYVRFDQKNKTVQRKLLQQNNDINDTNRQYKDQIILLKKDLKKQNLQKKKNLKKAIQEQNVQLKINNVMRKIVKQKNKRMERNLIQDQEMQYENIQGFEVLENIQKIHTMQQPLFMEETLKSEILQRIQHLIQWKNISISRQQKKQNNHNEIQSEKFIIRINEIYHQQIRYMLDALENVENRKFQQQVSRIKMLQDRRKKIKANQLLTEEYDLSAFKDLDEDHDFQELMQENMMLERQISKQSSQLQLLRSEFMKNKNLIDYSTKSFHVGLEKNKKQILKKMHNKLAENVKEFLSKNKILFILCSFILIQIIQLQYVIIRIIYK